MEDHRGGIEVDLARGFVPDEIWISLTIPSMFLIRTPYRFLSSSASLVAPVDSSYPPRACTILDRSKSVPTFTSLETWMLPISELYGRQADGLEERRVLAGAESEKYIFMIFHGAL